MCHDILTSAEENSPAESLCVHFHGPAWVCSAKGGSMARSSRCFIPGKVYHLSQTGNNNVPVFHSDVDRRRYLEILRIAAEAEQCAIHGWCLLEQQVDLLVSAPGTESISRMMCRAQGRYARWFNRVWQRSGSLWRKRFRHTAITAETDLPGMFRHLDRLPVLRGIVENPLDYPWSSHGCLANGRKSELLTPHWIYLGSGRTAHARRAAYRKWIRLSSPVWVWLPG